MWHKQSFDRVKNHYIGHTAIAASGGHELLVQLLAFEITDESWRARFCAIDDPENTWWIGLWRWNQQEYWYVAGNYWHFPYLSERYVFDHRIVRQASENRQ